MSQQIKKQNPGFTLPELLVSIAIIGFITSAVIANFNAQNKNNLLSQNAEVLISQIKRAQTMALTGELISGAAPKGYGFGIGQCVSLPCSYFLFADSDGDLNYDNGEKITGAEFNLDKNIEINSILPTDPVYLVFTPPFATLYINGGRSTSEVMIRLRHQGTSQIKNVKVNRLTKRMWVE